VTIAAGLGAARLQSAQACRPYHFEEPQQTVQTVVDVLPVRLSGPFGLKRAGKGKSWNLEPADAKSPLLAGLSFEQQPKVLWHHFVTPKADMQVVLTAGDKPALILGRYGNGGGALLTLSPTALEGQGEIAWWSWNGWFPLARNMTTWLSEC
jgi:hypothetical protein